MSNLESGARYEEGEHEIPFTQPFGATPCERLETHQGPSGQFDLVDDLGTHGRFESLFIGVSGLGFVMVSI
jgi:hypothetical protein